MSIEPEKSAMKRRVKNIVRITAAVTITVFALIGAFICIQKLQYSSIEKFALEKDKGLEYDKDLLYRKDAGSPVFLVNPSYRTTLFFIEGFRIPNSSEAWYGDWLKKMHRDLKVNIIAPMYGLQGWPFKERNRDWVFQEDMRTVLQIYQAYTSLLSKNHRVVVSGMSFGTLPALTICARAERKPDALMLLSPLNSKLDFRLSGPTIAWIAEQMMAHEWLSQVIMFNKPAVAPNRATQYDIVNSETSRFWMSKRFVCPEDNMRQGYLSHHAAIFMEKNIVPQVKGYPIEIIWGDDDLFFSQKGFSGLAEQLSEKNTVKTMIMPNAGHSILLDNGFKKVRAHLEAMIKNRN